MQLLETLEKTFTIGDLFKYVTELIDQLYGLESVNATQAEIKEIGDKENTAFSFIADFAFSGDRETVENILRAEGAAGRALNEQRYKEIPDGIDESLPFN